MNAMRVLRWLALGLLVVFMPASATFHLMKIVEVFAGTPASPDARYVVLQMYAPGQQFVAGHQVRVYDAAGNLIASYTFPGNLSNGASQARILVATPQAEAFFGVGADLAMSATMVAAGGKVCFDSSIDCVAWGSYAGSPAGVGAAFQPSGGLPGGRAAIRRLDIAGSATVLDATDDTDNCANDFVLGTPVPRNNANQSGTIPGATCGNGMLEGLEQCDDGNASNGDGCSSSCLPDTVVAARRGDFDADGRSDLMWRQVAVGSNAIWRSANAATAVAIPAVSTSWIVAGIGDLNGDRKGDVVWRNTSSGANAVWYSANAATSQSLVGVTNQQWSIVGIGDFDGDGHGDLLWRNTASGANTLWRSGNAATSQAVTGVTNTAWIVAGVGDINADGLADVVWRNSQSGANALWLSADSRRAYNLTAVTNTQWRIVGTDDFDGDGKADLLWRNVASGSNVIWRGAVSSNPQAVTGVTNLAWFVATTGDYNGDGRADLAWRNAGSGANALWLSANAGTTQPVAAVSNTQWAIMR